MRACVRVPRSPHPRRALFIEKVDRVCGLTQLGAIECFVEFLFQPGSRRTRQNGSWYAEFQRSCPVHFNGSTASRFGRAYDDQTETFQSSDVILEQAQ